MRHIVQHPEAPDIGRVDPERLTALGNWIYTEIETALSARTMQEAAWRDCLRLYEGVPKNPVRNIPVENAPNIEVTLGAIAADSIYAQAIDLIYTVSPLITVRPVTCEHDAELQKERALKAKAMQRFSNWIAENEAGVRAASENTILDDVQLGTGVYYIPYVKHTKKAKAHTVTSSGPEIFSIAPEDFVVPGGACDDLQKVRWCALRTWLTEAELQEQAMTAGWNLDGVIPVGVIGWMKTYRERLGRTATDTARSFNELYEIFDIYCSFDIDGDDLWEDLLVTWDRSSRKILKYGFTPYDHRPFSAMRYQLRAHLFYGLGVIEMIKPYQEEATELHNARTLNVQAANCRIWAAKEGTVPESMKIWFNKVVQVGESVENLKALEMGSVHTGSETAEAMTISLAERRVGVNEMSLPRPSQVMGSRTPGITALSLLQQMNRRFTPAFDGIRLGTAEAIRQCLYRYQEQLLSGETGVEAHIQRILGIESGQLVIDTLKDKSFDEHISLELTASSVSVNREADRQNALMLVGVLSQYYQRCLELVAIAANPQTPEPVREVAKKIAEAAGELIDRTLRAFDQIRDPSAFIIQFEEELDHGMGGLDQQGLAGLGDLFGLLGQAGQGGGGRSLPATSPEGAGIG